MEETAGPYLVIAAFWTEHGEIDAVLEAVSRKKFPTPEGKSRGCVVAFRNQVATDPQFVRDLAKFDLESVHEGNQ